MHTNEILVTPQKNLLVEILKELLQFLGIIPTYYSGSFWYIVNKPVHIGSREKS